MEKLQKWYDLVALNIYWLGINITTNILPVLLPALILMFMPENQKSTALANIRVVGLVVAMLIQPLAGLFSDRNRSRWGRRRPFIFASALLSIAFLFFIGLTPRFIGSAADAYFLPTFGVTTAYAALLLAIVLIQFSSNLGQGAALGLIPDNVSTRQRGMASGFKSLMEILPLALVFFVGKFIDAGQNWLVIGIMMAGFLATMLVTIFTVHETPITEKPDSHTGKEALRLVALTAIFFVTTRVAIWLISLAGSTFQEWNLSATAYVLAVGAVGLICMAGSVFIGVILGATVGIGKEAANQRSFIWWIVNRLLILAAVTGVRDFAQYYLRDVLKVANPATENTRLLLAIAAFLVPATLVGGKLGDVFGRKRMLLVSALIAAAGTVLLITVPNMMVVYIAGAVVGLGYGFLMACSWALGTDLAPAKEAGKYLGISNLAGAGAGIVGTGIGGPMADSFNAISGGLGYILIYSIYAGLILISILVLANVKDPGKKPFVQE
ncbi:MAG: MFS transporter [Anaerolineaceae bacterium]|nr:MFS transporter [Anaerolineaceae bacterium]